MRRFAPQKRAALAEHRAQVYGSGRAGTLFRTLLRLPTPIFATLLGREWFVDPAVTPTAKVSGDLSKKNLDEPTICSLPGITASSDSECFELKLETPGVATTQLPATGGFFG